MAELTLVSRFPYGMAPDVLQALLAHHNQTALAAVRAPAASAAIDAFVDAARNATGRYHDQVAAILDGYRPIGRDFPAMGQHWIHVARVFDGTLDVALPEVLSYVDIDGAPVLTGVAYALPLLADETPPVWPTDGAEWHDHAGTIEEETAGAGAHGAHPAAARMAMVHAWIWTENPIVGESTTSLTAEQGGALSGAWTRLWREIDDAVSPDTRSDLAMLSIRKWPIVCRGLHQPSTRPPG